MKIIKRTLLLLIVMLMIFGMNINTCAQDDSSITIHYEPGVCEFSFYRVADFSEQNGLTPMKPFDLYTETASLLDKLENLDSAQLRTLAFTLEALVSRDSVTPSFIASSDIEGELVLKNPEKGMYLIIGKQTRDDKYIYTPSPFLVTVPAFSEDGQGINNHIVVDMGKVQKEEIKEEFIDFRVMKIWKDAGNESKRPLRIRVVLLKDGELYERVILDAENNWTYSWNHLASGHIWTAVEESKPSSYTMSVEKDQKGAVITNTYSGPTSPKPEKLPQTGQLWWPVPILFCLGFTLLVLGGIERKKCKSDIE